MQISPYLSFNGECEAAFRFYEQCLGGQIEGIFRYAGSRCRIRWRPTGRTK